MKSKVTMIGQTQFHALTASKAVYDRTGGVEIDFEDASGASLIEFSGRACYDSWGRPNPATAHLQGYLHHIIEVGHTSVLEHGTVSFYVEGVSRSLTHELVRHRVGFSYSQLSQRFVVLKKSEINVGQLVSGQEPWVVPPLFEGDFVAASILETAWNNACDAYDQLLERAEQILEGGDETTGLKKRAREAARAVLPNMTPTAIAVTGNHTAWRQTILKRASVHADAEICAVFVDIFRQLERSFPELYQDMHIMNNGDRDWVCGCNAGRHG